LDNPAIGIKPLDLKSDVARWLNEFCLRARRRRDDSTVIPRTVRLSEAPNFARSIFEYEPNGTGARLL